MAKKNINVDQLVRQKPTAADLFYPTVPSYEEVKEGASDTENQKREIRNKRRRLEWEKECKHIRNRGPLTDRCKWDEADIKVKSILYLSPRTDASRMYHQHNLHTLIDRCSTKKQS